jgi:hypothetical protein
VSAANPARKSARVERPRQPSVGFNAHGDLRRGADVRYMRQPRGDPGSSLYPRELWPMRTRTTLTRKKSTPPVRMTRTSALP